MSQLSDDAKKSDFGVVGVLIKWLLIGGPQRTPDKPQKTFGFRLLWFITAIPLLFIVVCFLWHDGNSDTMPEYPLLFYYAWCVLVFDIAIWILRAVLGHKTLEKKSHEEDDDEFDHLYVEKSQTQEDAEDELSLDDDEEETKDSVINLDDYFLPLKGSSLQLIKVKAGRFLMGSPVNELGKCNDEILHRVTLTKDFWLGRTPVTQGQWTAIMGNNPSEYQKGHNYPVEQVSWNDAMDFCKKLNEKLQGKMPEGYQFSLPTEAQWEYACRAGTTTSLNSGKDIRKCANLNEVGWYDGDDSTQPVAQKKPNAWGFYDMHGNVWEWCSDWYQEDYGCNNSDATDPQGPPSGSYRVNRGGCWYSSAWECRSASRDRLKPSDCCHAVFDIDGCSVAELGFRLALVPVQ